MVELIVSHSNTDFDGLASMVAASKLYPEAVLVFEGKPTRQVREFLALHKDALPILDIKSVDLEKVTRVILVDTRFPTKGGSLVKLLSDEQIKVHIYDHHPASSQSIKGELEVIEEIGAATTLLVEQLRQRKLGISSFEATLLALGIHEDTGNLLFESTTARDAAALSILLEAGANLKIVGEFMDRPLSREQKSLLNTLLSAARHYLIKGTKVLITTASIDEFVGGLALLTHKISEIENLDVIFAVVKMDDRVHLVARGKGKSVAVNELLREFGGAGHPKAASATVKNGDVEEIVNKLLSLLEERVCPENRASEIMSNSVKRISNQSSVEQARTMLLRYGHTGLPVVDGDKLVGIISRRDVDKAMHHGLGHALVTGYMSRQVVTIGPDATLSEIQELMIDHDIGRLPVVDQGKLLGIISRSDVLRTLHGQAVPMSHQIRRQRSKVQGREILRLIEALPQEIRDLFNLVRVLGKERQVKVFVVGGFVRDLLLGVANLDIDLVVEGDGLEFAAQLAQLLQAKAFYHPQFGTANLLTANGLNVDVATARTEYYEAPASLPTVERSSLKQDLYRRDFTINAMAIELDDEEFANLEDYYGGYRDLQQGLVRILHNLSFVDDPTRILRAVRFEQRFGFKIEAQTMQMLQIAVKDRLLFKLSRDRLKNELVLALQEQKAVKIFKRLVELGVWDLAFPGIPWEGVEASFSRIKPAVDFLKELGLWEGEIPWEVNLLVLLSAGEAEETSMALQAMRFERRQLTMVKEFLSRKRALKGFSSWEGELNKGMVHRLLDRMPQEILAAILTDQNLKQPVSEYLIACVKARVLVTGRDLKALNIPPGPVYKRLLSALWEARLEGKVQSKEEEIKLVKDLLKEEIDV